MSASSRLRSRHGTRPERAAGESGRVARTETWAAELGSEERLATRERQGLFETPSLGPCDVGAETSELIPPPAGIAARPGLSDEAIGEQPLDDAVQGSSAEPDGAIGEPFDLLHN